MRVEFPAGSLTAILGPSGSGKTTLLDFVTGNMSGGVKAKGEVSFDGTLAYVPQQDHLHGFYTPQSYMEHYARLSGQTVDEYTKANIDNMLGALGLSDCKDVRIGDIFLKGLSGGQKRRLSVALEANSSPKMFVLDEPTSGLDSESAYQLIKFLQTYSRGIGRRRVIITIHQPSSFLWELIDNVVLLSKGKLIYQGPRSGIESFFASNGHPTPPNYNPADHYVTVANDSFQSNKMETMSVEEWADRSNSSLKGAGRKKKEWSL
jgi:ABC-type multidrug transport system ATPase subunit